MGGATTMLLTKLNTMLGTAMIVVHSQRSQTYRVAIVKLARNLRTASNASDALRRDSEGIASRAAVPDTM